LFKKIGLNKFTFLLIILCTLSFWGWAQNPNPRGGGRDGGGGGGGLNGLQNRFGSYNAGSGNNKDSLKKRDRNADSITISYRFMNDTKRYFLDSSIIDYIRFPVQPQHIVLGNTGAASKPILYTPFFKAGFDQGRHGYDAYKWNVNNVKFYRTTRPYTELGYVLGSKSEQTIHLTHTQNVKPDWNIAVDYRLISAPGYFRSQKNNHNNVAIGSYYQGKRKRYANWFIILNNSLKANDNGGIKKDSQLVDANRADRALVETRLNNNIFSARNPFDSKLESGHWNKERLYLLKQSYDIGKNDSIVVNDSTTNYLFYPKLRLEHTFTYSKEYYSYLGLQQDSDYYVGNYGADTLYNKSLESFTLKDEWKRIGNDFSIYQFPDTKNTQQFIKAGISFELWKGRFTEGNYRSGAKDFSNLFIHGEYRNLTRNKKWDIDAMGIFYLSGYNAGDYEAHASLARNLNAKLGNLRLQFQNVNRTPSFIYYEQSSFNLGVVPNLKKENHTQLTAQFYNEKKQQNISVQLLLATNAITWRGYKTYQQEAAFNMLKVKFERAFKVYRKIVWRTEAQFQQVLIGNPSINFPALYTRNKIAYEGNFGKKNLRIATGIEIRYLSPYKLDAWSPLTGQFIYQDSVSSKKNLPDINLYMNFNITSFNAFIRIENINTASIKSGAGAGLKFINNNYAAQFYPNPGLVIHFGIYWRFVN
jgi:hypothetical protein